MTQAFAQPEMPAAEVRWRSVPKQFVDPPAAWNPTVGLFLGGYALAALTIWGWFDTNPPAELVKIRSDAFAGLRNLGHHYGAARRLVDAVPESTLRATPDQISLLYPAQWKVLSGADVLENDHV